jgi:hypothetical protein
MEPQNSDTADAVTTPTPDIQRLRPAPGIELPSLGDDEDDQKCPFDGFPSGKVSLRPPVRHVDV